MRLILRYWRNLNKDKKQEIKQKHNVKVITFELIEKIYEESKKETDNNV